MECLWEQLPLNDRRKSQKSRRSPFKWGLFLSPVSQAAWKQFSGNCTPSSSSLFSNALLLVVPEPWCRSIWPSRWRSSSARCWWWSSTRRRRGLRRAWGWSASSYIHSPELSVVAKKIFVSSTKWCLICQVGLRDSAFWLSWFLVYAVLISCTSLIARLVNFKKKIK